MAVTFDAVGPSSSGFTFNAGNPSSPVTWSHSVAASASALLVEIAFDGATATGVSCTAGGTSMTADSHNGSMANNGSGSTFVFTLLNPPTGSITISIAFTVSGANGASGGSLSFKGATGFGTSVTTTGLGATGSVTVSGTGSASLVAAFESLGDPPVSPGSPAVNDFGANALGGGGSTNGNSAGAHSAGGGNVTVSWATGISGDTWRAWAVEVQGSGASPGEPLAAQVPPGMRSPMALARPDWYSTAPQAPPPVQFSAPPSSEPPPGLKSPMALARPDWYSTAPQPFTQPGPPLFSQPPSAEPPPGLKSPMALARPDWYSTAPQPPAPQQVSPPPLAALPPGLQSPMSLARPDWYPSSDAVQGQVIITDSDSAHGTDAGEGIALSSAESSAGTDAGETITLTSSDSGTTSDGSSTGLQDSDTLTGTDSQSVAATLSDSDTAHGTDTTGTVGLASADSSAAADGSETVTLTSSDSGTTSDGSSTGLQDSDAAHGADGGEAVLAVQPQVQASRLLPPGLRSPMSLGHREWYQTAPQPAGGIVITDSDSCQGIDSGFSFLSDSDSCTGTEGSLYSFAFRDSDASFSAERELTAWPGSSDSCTGTDGTGSWYTVATGASDSDSCHATEGVIAYTFPVSDFTESCTGTETQIIDVYTYQPPFRWTGGQYEVRFGERVVWSGSHPDRSVLELAATLAASAAVEFPQDHDECHAEEDQAPLTSVTLIAEPAVIVRFTQVTSG